MNLETHAPIPKSESSFLVTKQTKTNQLNLAYFASPITQNCINHKLETIVSKNNNELQTIVSENKIF